MTTVLVFIQRCLVFLAIFLCYSHVRGVSVDCERQPFHQACRGMMTRKRAMFQNLYGTGCDGSKASLNCIKELEERVFPYVPLSKSRLLITLLDNDMQKDVTHTARHRLRSNEIDDRRTPLMESFLSELESSDSNY